MENEMPENPKVNLFVIPGGMLPKRQTEEAAGYDAHFRAIISLDEKDPQNPILRKTLFDFKNTPVDPEIAKHVREENGELIYILEPNELVLCGIGFTVEMPFPMYYEVKNRSNLSTRHGIVVANACTIVDSDYRGEAGVLLQNRSSKSFSLTHNMRIAQIVFKYAVIPEIQIVKNPGYLTNTKRSGGGFGSTGL